MPYAVMVCARNCYGSDLVAPTLISQLRDILGKHVSQRWIDQSLANAGLKLGFEREDLPDALEAELVEFVMTRVRGFVDEGALAQLMLDVADVFVEHQAEIQPGLVAPPTQHAQPVMPVSPRPTEDREPGDDGRMHVLIVDDEVISLSTISTMVHLLGHAPDRALSSDEAKAHVKGRDYDAVVVDCYMPGTSGFELIRWLRTMLSERSEQAHRATTRIIAISSNSDEGTQTLAMRAGADSVLVKPLSRRTLAQVLSDGSAVRE